MLFLRLVQRVSDGLLCHAPEITELHDGAFQVSRFITRREGFGQFPDGPSLRLFDRVAPHLVEKEIRKVMPAMVEAIAMPKF